MILPFELRSKSLSQMLLSTCRSYNELEYAGSRVGGSALKLMVMVPLSLCDVLREAAVRPMVAVHDPNTRKALSAIAQRTANLVGR